jgi:hypothetical protein
LFQKANYLHEKDSNFTIPGIAINITGKLTEYCDWDGEDSNAFLGYGVPGGCNLIQTLHGIDPHSCKGQNTISGCLGLKHVHWV